MFSYVNMHKLKMQWFHQNTVQYIHHEGLLQ